MKPYFFICIFLIAFGSSDAQTIRSIVKFQALDILMEDQASFMLEKRINGNSSITFSLGLGFNYVQREHSNYSLTRDYTLDVSYRRFLASILDDAPKKFYISINAIGEYAQYESGREDDAGNSMVHASAYPIIGSGIAAGYQFVVRDRFAFDLSYNPIVKFPLPTDELKQFDPTSNDVIVDIFKPRIGIGIAFTR